MGDVQEMDTFMAAVIDGKAFERITGYIEHAKASPHLSIVAGGNYDGRLVTRLVALCLFIHQMQIRGRWTNLSSKRFSWHFELVYRGKY